MKMKNLRWWVITLIAIATIINYIAIEEPVEPFIASAIHLLSSV